MLDLGKLLDRFKDSLDRDVRTREAVAECIKEALGFDVRLEDISIKGDTLRIQTSPAKRNEIKLHEARVLEAVIAKTKQNLKRVAY